MKTLLIIGWLGFFGVELDAQIVTSRPSSYVPRENAAVAFEPNSGYGYLFGGSVGSNELWRHDEGLWLPVVTANAAPAMTSPVACSWSGHGMLVFGNGQTWLFDGVDWAPIVTATSPPGMHSMAFDPVRNLVVAFESTTRTWEFDGSNWLPRTITWPAGGPPVQVARLAWEPNTQSVAVVAGASLGGGMPGFLVHRWTGTSWTNGVLIPARPGFSVCTAPGNGGILISGGWEFPFYTGATALWNGTQLGFPGPGAPAERLRSHSWFDSVHSRAVVTNGGPGDFGTWHWNGIEWSRPPAGTLPSFPNASCYDTWRGLLLQFGGRQAPSVDTEQFLARDVGGTWHPQLTGPGRRCDQACAFDSWRGRFVMMGGVHPDTGGAHEDLVEPATHEWDGSQWISTPAPWPWNLQIHPYSRARAAMAFDRQRGRCVLFGGEVPYGQPIAQGMRNDTWQWDGTVWTRMQPTAVPPAVFGRMFFDPDLGRCVLQAGGTWTWDGSDWSALVLPSVPGTTTLPPLAYDEAQEVYVASTPTGTWELRNGSWQLVASTPFLGGQFDLGLGRFVGKDQQSWYETGAAAAAMVHAFGEACTGSAGKPVLHAERPFRLATTRSLQPANLPPGAAFFGVLGSDAPTFAGLPLPIDLTAFGMPQCWLHTELAANELCLNGTWLIAVPANITLLGGWFRLQALVLDPAANSLGITTTNGLRLRIGA